MRRRQLPRCQSAHAAFEDAPRQLLVPALLEGFRTRWGQRWPEAVAYTDYRQMLERGRLDLLSVVTPDHVHANLVIDAVRAPIPEIFSNCRKAKRSDSLRKP